MERRGFIKVLAAGGAVAVFPAALSSCSASGVKPAKSVENDYQDIRLKLIAYAMLAPSSHNIQPWLVRLTGSDGFNLYVDQDRLLPKADPPARQIHISQGTFLETFRIAASNFGYRVDFDYFPQGEYSNQTVENKPVASVRLVSDSTIKPDPLFELLAVRQSNKRGYADRQIPASDLRVIRNVKTAAGIGLFADGSKQLKSQLAPILGKSMAIEANDVERNKELANLFRFNEQEAIAMSDGFTVANSGTTGVMRFIVEKLFLGTRKEASAVDSAFAKEGIKATYKQAKTAAAYGWIVTKTNTRRDQLETGHIYARINLLTSKLGIAQHPMSQILEEYEDMSSLQQEFLNLLKIPRGSTVQMLYRLGYAEATPQTRRRGVKDIMLT